MTKQDSQIVKYSEDLTWSANDEHKGFRVIFSNTHKLSQRFFMRIFALRFRCLTSALMMEKSITAFFDISNRSLVRDFYLKTKA